MTVEELEQEVTRLRGVLETVTAARDALERRIVQVNEHHSTLTTRNDELLTEIRDTQKSVRYLLRKARGEEEAL